MGNIDGKTVADFGKEWAAFDQGSLDHLERQSLFDRYFGIFPKEALHESAAGFDFGCGSGRWAAVIAGRVGTLHCLDASAQALEVARRNLSFADNCRFHLCNGDDIPLADGTMDFGYSLGVLHHIPDTAAGLRNCVRKLKTGAPFLLYLYYRFDNRPFWFRLVWQASDLLRKLISRMPFPLKYAISQLIAAFVYFPLARVSAALGTLGLPVRHIPLSYYRNLSFYTMRTDALDRFGTRLEQRFTAKEIEAMMTKAGLGRIAFSPAEPYWCAVGYRIF